MAWRMKILGTATTLFAAPLYLQAYDVDFQDGLGKADLTADPALALVFLDPGHVLQTWAEVSSVRPFRWDGRPNRPLTTYTIEPEKVS